MIIGMVRHGNTDWNALGKIQGQTDIPLNELGKKQANALASRLSQDEKLWDAVISSDLQRARQTAAVIADKLDIPLLDGDPRLRERNFGEVEGLTLPERVERWGENWREVAQGLETDEEVRARGLAFLQDWQKQRPEGRLLVVSHGGFLAQMFDTLCVDLEKQHLGNLSYSILQFKDEQWAPLLYNCTRHLEEEQGVTTK
ncbi:histidine phosphatase family protein [Paenibacillus sp. ATY16]|uniref:histidine phosphatase family protein n=1 Tax=Paenibacillus sp. ATY16 TaxID=1759312 RepID=UPI00200CD644|nr:histidine phosphatase family protein [Paenibacillus sp. ATY16]MCK9857430.1 histidine phosphatase family protein [Paenibacillus sp. ATY16]